MAALPEPPLFSRLCLCLSAEASQEAWRRCRSRRREAPPPRRTRTRRASTDTHHAHGGGGAGGGVGQEAITSQYFEEWTTLAAPYSSTMIFNTARPMEVLPACPRRGHEYVLPGLIKTTRSRCQPVVTGLIKTTRSRCQPIVTVLTHASRAPHPASPLYYACIFSAARPLEVPHPDAGPRSGQTPARLPPSSIQRSPSSLSAAAAFRPLRTMKRYGHTSLSPASLSAAAAFRPLQPLGVTAAAA